MVLNYKYKWNKKHTKISELEKKYARHRIQRDIMQWFWLYYSEIKYFKYNKVSSKDMDEWALHTLVFM